MVLLIDNYDSFTYNIYQQVSAMGESCQVHRNDEITVEQIADMKPSRIILSPGPGRPESAGICLDIIKRFAGEIPILGICLGHQAIAQSFGADIVHAPTLMHGKLSDVFHEQQGVFEGVSSPCSVVRYHSLMVDEKKLPACLSVSARSADGVIMGIRHIKYALEGIQFHPESILTHVGQKMLSRFLSKAFVSA